MAKVMYCILKLPFNHPDWCREPKGPINVNNYVPVWMNTVEEPEDVNNLLEDLFTKFNLNHPENYAASSMSVGDIVAITTDNKIKYYLCCGIGWKEIEPECSD